MDTNQNAAEQNDSHIKQEDTHQSSVRESFAWDEKTGTLLIFLASLGCFFTTSGISHSLGLEPRFLWFIYFISGIFGGVWIRKSETKGFLLVLIVGVIGEAMSFFTLKSIPDPNFFTAVYMLSPGLLFLGYCATRSLEKFGPALSPRIPLKEFAGSAKTRIGLACLMGLLTIGFVLNSQNSAHREIDGKQTVIEAKDSEIKRLESELSDKNTQIKKHMDAIASKDNRIDQLMQESALKQTQIATQDNQIASQASQITEKQNRITEISNNPKETPWYKDFIDWLATIGMKALFDWLLEQLQKFISEHYKPH